MDYFNDKVLTISLPIIFSINTFIFSVNKMLETIFFFKLLVLYKSTKLRGVQFTVIKKEKNNKNVQHFCPTNDLDDLKMVKFSVDLTIMSSLLYICTTKYSIVISFCLHWIADSVKKDRKQGERERVLRCSGI